MEQKQLNECVRVWSKMYEHKHGEAPKAPTKQQVAEVRALYKALYNDRRDYHSVKPTIRKGYDINRHNGYNPVNSRRDQYYSTGQTDTGLMPAVRTKKGDIYILSLHPTYYTTMTSEDGVVRTLSQDISRPSSGRFALIANKWAPEGTRKNHITDALLVRFKPHIISALMTNGSYWALSYNGSGSYPAWIDWSAFVEIAHQEANSDWSFTFNIETESTKHNTKEIENKLKEMMV